MRRVVVGVPDTTVPTAALQRAVLEARRRRLPLTVLHGCAAPFDRAPGEDALASLRERLHVAVLACSATEIVVDIVLAAAEATPALLAAAEGAALLVVGGRCRDESGGHLLGTISGGCLQAALCPVMVVPAGSHEEEPHGRVVVAVDDRGTSHAALAWASAQANANNQALEVIVACPPDRDPDVVRARVSAALRDAAAGAPVGAVRVLQGPAVAAISSCLAAEDLLVVGSRGHSSLLGLLLTSTSAALVARAVCPTVVVRAGQSRRELHVRREQDVGPAQQGRSPLADARRR